MSQQKGFLSEWMISCRVLSLGYLKVTSQNAQLNFPWLRISMVSLCLCLELTCKQTYDAGLSMTNGRRGIWGVFSFSSEQQLLGSLGLLT